MRLGGSLVSLVAAYRPSGYSAPGIGAGMPAVRSQLKITFAVEDHLCTRNQSAGRCRQFLATAQTASPAAEAPSAAWRGARSARAPANRGDAVRRVRRPPLFAQSTTRQASPRAAAQCGEAGVIWPRAGLPLKSDRTEMAFRRQLTPFHHRTGRLCNHPDNGVVPRERAASGSVTRRYRRDAEPVPHADLRARRINFWMRPTALA
jgi:hypothetical protein